MAAASWEKYSVLKKEAGSKHMLELNLSYAVILNQLTFLLSAGFTYIQFVNYKGKYLVYLFLNLSKM